MTSYRIRAMTRRAASGDDYSKLRRKVGTKTQVARLLEVALRTVQRREDGGIPVTKEAWLALKALAELPDYAGDRRPEDTDGLSYKDRIELEDRKRAELRAAGLKGAETRRRRRGD
jgi:phage terminase Nu1 subunit (DNA packaging protein)